MSKILDLYTAPAIPVEWVEECLVRHGQPKRIASDIRRSVQLRFLATIFYFDVIEAENGDPDAKLRVDLFRESQEHMRAAEIAIGNDPDVGPTQGVRARIGAPERLRRGDVERELRRPSERPKLILPRSARRD